MLDSAAMFCPAVRLRLSVSAQAQAPQQERKPILGKCLRNTMFELDGHVLITKREVHVDFSV